MIGGVASGGGSNMLLTQVLFENNNVFCVIEELKLAAAFASFQCII